MRELSVSGVRSGLEGPSPVPSSLVVAGVAGIGIVVLGAILANMAVYLVALLILLAGAYLLLRHPSAVAYVALCWLVFEKGIGGHFGSLQNPISTAGDGLLVLALFEVVLVNLLRRKWPVLTFGPVGAGLFAFVGLGLVSTMINNVSMHVATLGIISTIHSVIIFLVIINLGLTAQDVNKFVTVALVIMSIAGLIGVLQIVPHSPAWVLGGEHLMAGSGILRVDGPFDHPNSNADYLIMIVPLAFVLWMWGGVERRWRGWLLAGTAVMSLSLLFTFSREAWLALPVGILLLGITTERRLLHIFMVYVVPAGLAFLLLFAPFANRLAETTNGNLRLTLLQLSWPLIQSHFFLGVGPGMFGGHVALITHSPLYAQYGLTDFFYGTGNQIDMFWTHLLAESGLLGLAAYIGMLVACFLVGHRAYVASHDARRKAILLGLMFAIPSAGFVSLVSPTLEAGPGATLFWALMGMLVVMAYSPDPARSRVISQ